METQILTGPDASSRSRIDSIDILRGLVMILMALDHARDYFGAAGINSTNPANTTVPLYFTRWITHFCAPVFFLLTGTGACLALRRMSRGQLSQYLFTRGLWLILLELVILRGFGWQFNFDYRVTMLTVLWALGWAMILLSVLVFLPTWAVSVVGVVMIATHNLFDAAQPAQLGALAPLWNILHAPGLILNKPSHMVFVAYTLVPWVGVTAAGYGLGQVFAWDNERRRAFLLRLGIAVTVAFVVLRSMNVYGDPLPWSNQKSSLFTMLSFLNTNKYPPSLLFLLMTLGPALILLRTIDGKLPGLLRPALVFGKVPLFYFMLHVVLIHLLAVVVCYARYGEVHWMFESNRLDQFPITQPPEWPVGLPVVYLIWAFVVVALYPVCRWFAGVKQRRRDRWLSYL